MATQSFTKTFSVNRQNAQKVARVLSSNKKTSLKRDFCVNSVKKESVRTFLGFGEVDEF